MFEFSRELKRLFSGDGAPYGLTSGDPALLEVLDLALLRAEAKAADVAAGRISAKDPARRRLDCARIWRELARRTGDPSALRNAALAAEKAVDAFERDSRKRDWAAGRCEQAAVAMLGAELYGDDGLNAAAEFALQDVREKAPGASAAVIALGRLARLSGRAALRSGDAAAVRAAARRYDAAIEQMEARLKARAVAKGQVVELRADRAEGLAMAGARLKDAELVLTALAELDTLVHRLDPTYEPVSWARVQELRGSARAALGDICGRVEDIADGMEAMAAAIDMVGSHHSPLDWARAQHALAGALQAMGEAGGSERAFDQAVSCFDRALWALRDQPSLSLRVIAAGGRASCLARRAEVLGDRASLDEAVEALRAELAAARPGRDPVGWAIRQLNLARLYEARAALPGGDAAQLAAAAVALDAALDVFGEHGLRSLADQAARAMERLRQAAS